MEIIQILNSLITLIISNMEENKKKEEYRKLRLLVTTLCPNKCPLCCNNSWDFSKLPVVNRWNYDEIMFTGGEPLLFPDKVATLAKSIKTIAKEEGNNPKLYIYTAVCDIIKVTSVIQYVDGIVLTPHNLSDIPKFIDLNNFMKNNNSFNGKSMRLNLFSNIKEALPIDIDLSMWHIKDMEWIKDCPVPKGEDFRRVSELWSE